MALLTGVSTFVLLFLAFGSVVLPLKAIVMNVLSLSATFGVVVWIFQWGHLSRLLQFTPTGSIDPGLRHLVPATMRLLGRGNWWAPRPLRRLDARYGISDEIQAERAGVPV
jgi:uncharacterized membrane protein YdfJ with MMPL/SSD domain